ncbi:WhiB family transcriptional regulator [Actinoalloteichus spitiensis]|uniref:WhiB family transcriptional regulator n=1 Tax=Actinoalloteichus spitiensis TaxID=252394 RepID=UPI00058545EE|nr:WhiB family transcriptional regulator [Actinoalloteichus spitiensis]
MTSTKRLPQPVAELWDWQLEAACREIDPSVFFFSEGERGAARTIREERAKRICETCPVMLRCRAHALASGERYGVWGGLAEGERRELLNRLRDETRTSEGALEPQSTGG